MENEVWRDIEGYEGLYQVSNLGRVKSLGRFRKGSGGQMVLVKEKFKIHHDNGHGYKVVSLYKNNRVQTVYVHRLVAAAFIPNFANYEQVNHKDENKSNNRVGNLEWCTPKYNSNYGTARIRNSALTRNHPNTSRPVLQFDMNGKFIKEWPSLREPQRCKIASSSSISRVCRGIEKQANGFIWRYK